MTLEELGRLGTVVYREDTPAAGIPHIKTDKGYWCLRRDVPSVPTAPCSGCRRADPTKPFGSPQHVAEELGGM